MNKFRVGVLGATGMVGQRFLTLLESHPWFEVALVAASSRSAGKSFAEAVADRWRPEGMIPPKAAGLIVQNVLDVNRIAESVDFVFSAVKMKKAEIEGLELAYAKKETPVISNNSVHRWTPDVPVIIPEVNGRHVEIIDSQRFRLKTRNGFIAAKPNCSLQSYVPALEPIRDLGLKEIRVATYQAASGAGRNLADWPELQDNLLCIDGEEDKSAWEPKKIWGRIFNQQIYPDTDLDISVHCLRVPVSDGHEAVVWVKLDRPPRKEEIIRRWREFTGEPQQLNLPSAPKPFLQYLEMPDRPQPKLDRDFGCGMGISIGQLRNESNGTFAFKCLSHNTIRGAAGGAILTAELLSAKKYLVPK